MQADQIIKLWNDCNQAQTDGLALKFARGVLAAAMSQVVADERQPGSEVFTLYSAINQLVTHIGAYGEVDSSHITVDAVMSALHALDGGGVAKRVHDLVEKAFMPVGQASRLAVDEYIAIASSRAALAAAQGHTQEPFMFAIMKPDGKAHIDENCVGYDAADLNGEVNSLNDSPDTGYSTVPVYLSAARTGTLTLTGHQLRMALDLINPGGHQERDELDDELTFGIRMHESDDHQVSTGMCCWSGDTDGVLPLDGEYEVPVAPVPRANEPAGSLVEVLREVRHSLQFANDSVGGGITDTLWMMNQPQTVFDYIDAALESAQAQALVPIAAASADIFDLIREWAYLPDGQRGAVERNIIGCLNRSFNAGMIDGKALGALSAPAQARNPVAYRWPDGPGKFYYQDVSDPVADFARTTAQLLYAAPVQPVAVPEGWRAAINRLMDFAPTNEGPLPGMTRGGNWLRKHEVIEALSYLATPAPVQPVAVPDGDHWTTQQIKEHTHDITDCEWVQVKSATPAAQDDAKDAERLEFIESSTFDLRCYNDHDNDVYWNVIEHHMAAPIEREIGWGNTARQAIDAAIAAKAAS